MRKVCLLIIAISLLIAPIAFAFQADDITESIGLTDTDGVLWSDKALTASTGTYYSLGIKTTFLEGFTALLIETDDSLTITFEVSADNTTYYTPYDTSGNTLNTIATTLSTDRWVVFDPQVAIYIRFKVVANSNATTSITLLRR